MLFLVVVFIATLLSLSYYQVSKNINENAVKLQQNVQATFESEIAQQIALLESDLQFIQRNPFLQSAFLQQDRQQLMKIARPIYHYILKPNHITHFYFTQTDCVYIVLKTMVIRFNAPP